MSLECCNTNLPGQVCPLVQQWQNYYGVINCILIGSEAHSTEGSACLLLWAWSKALRMNLLVLLNVYIVKLPSKYVCVYTCGLALPSSLVRKVCL